jgi:hypothetical protein
VVHAGNKAVLARTHETHDVWKCILYKNVGWTSIIHLTASTIYRASRPKINHRTVGSDSNFIANDTFGNFTAQSMPPQLLAGVVVQSESFLAHIQRSRNAVVAMTAEVVVVVVVVVDRPVFAVEVLAEVVSAVHELNVAAVAI